LTAVACCGCAAPGPPLPPSLNLPQVVSASGLSASRVGGEVRLHWITPKQTTDKLLIKGPITAEVCRSPLNATPQPEKAPCVAVERMTVIPGETDAVDTLPGVLTEGPAHLLAYRVQLLNAAGRTAGPSAAVYAAAGVAPAAFAGFAGETTSAGVELRWQRQAEPGAGAVELDRTLLDPAAGAAAESKGGLPGAPKQATEIRMNAGNTDSPDAGGTVDRTVEVGHRYRYTAQRVQTVTVGGQTLQLRSTPSAALTFSVRDQFPPATPEGLVAVPGFGDGQPRQPAIDLSWEPVMDQDLKPKVAGYKVYRREDAGGEWRLLGQVTAAAYRDAAVVAGKQYAYRVTAVSTAGNESTASREAAETAPKGQP
jgi:hypothetical protein